MVNIDDLHEEFDELVGIEEDADTMNYLYQ